MKKLTTVLLSLTLLSTASYGAEDRVVGVYKGGEVKESQVMEQYKTALQAQFGEQNKTFEELDPNIQEALVKGYINLQLLDQEAKKSGVEDSKEFQDKLSAVKKHMLETELVDKYLKTAVTDKSIDDAYNQLVASLEGKEEVKVSHILVEKEEAAKDIKKKLSKGAKFAALAKELSKDEGSKANGGAIGYIVKGQLVPEFENVALNMKVGEISNPVKTQFGWHVITVTDKRKAHVPSKEEAKANIISKLNREAVEKYFAELASKADVKVTLPPRPANEKKDEAQIPEAAPKTEPKK